MSGGEVRRVSLQDIQLVQNLIERCLQLYMNQKEVVDTLLVQAKIEPSFTELVWQKLEEENREFFRAYHLRLIVKSQIMSFNKLLEKQAELMHRMGSAGVSSVPISNGSHTTSLNQAPSSFVAECKVPPSRPDNMHYPLGPSSTLINGGQSTHGNMLAGNTSAHSNMMDVSPNMLPSQNSNLRMTQEMNGMVIKSEPDYLNSSAFTFSINGNGLETHPTIGDASATFSSVESNSELLNEPLLDTDTSSFGFLGQIPRNFSLSDLTADFSQSSDILRSYSRSPFLATDTNNFLDHHERECQGENKRLDTISEGLSYEGFGND